MKYLVANWKMNQTIKMGEEFLKIFSKLYPNQRSVKIVIAPPYTSLNSLSHLARKENIPVYLGAQNMNQFTSGAYTGEISAEMIVEAGCQYVIIGHSERRHIFFETEEAIKQKYDRAIQNNLVPIVCFGETLQMYEAKETDSYIKNQLFLLQGENPPILAYEPVWAIGSGLIPELNEIIKVVQNVKLMFPSSALLYGGSVNPLTIKKIASIPNLDGFLVGGASLKVDSFFSLLKALEEVDG